MSNLLNEVNRHLNDDVIMQLTRQLGGQDPNAVKAASQGISQLLLQAISNNANNQEKGDGLFGALKRDHDGGILGDLMNVIKGQSNANTSKATDGTGIVNHLLGNRQLEAAQVISQMSGLDIFKSGVLMQLIAPVIMGVVGQTQRSNGLDLGGLARILLGGGGQGQQQEQSQNPLAGIFGKILDRDGDGSMMDDLLNMGMQILKK